MEQKRILDKLVSNMEYVSGGTFILGTTSESVSYSDDEWPAHQVSLSSFKIAKYEVTQEEWEAVMGSNPSYFKGRKRPVENVSFNDCQIFIHKLNLLTGMQFRLPTEAEWEFAARGGNLSNHYIYAGSNDVDNVAWYSGNSGGTTHNIGQKRPNELGLYDMSGNVWEWCFDRYGRYSSNAQTDPKGALTGSERVIRGGSWDSYFDKVCRVSLRFSSSPEQRDRVFGLRLAL